MARIYIAGPMKGYPGLNFKRFNQVAVYLRSIGHDVVSPVEVGEKLPKDTPIAEYLKADIREMIECDGIALLEGWEKSCGATCEAAVARSLGLDFYSPEGVQYLDPPEITIKQSYSKGEAVNWIPEDASTP